MVTRPHRFLSDKHRFSIIFTNDVSSLFEILADINLYKIVFQYRYILRKENQMCLNHFYVILIAEK